MRPPNALRRKYRGTLAIALAASVMLTMLPPIAAQAAPAAPTPSESTTSVSDAREPGVPATAVTSSVLHVGGTKELDYEPIMTFEDLPEDEVCSSWASAWVLATTQDGATSWGEEHTINLDGSVAIRFNQTGMRYPGGELTLTYFSKQGNGFNCHEQSLPDPKTLTSYKTETIDVDWAKPEIRDVYWVYDEHNGAKIHIEVDPSWSDFDTYQSMGGMAIYKIQDYKKSTQKIVPVSTPCFATQEPDRVGNTCLYQGSIPDAGDAIGFAALPDNKTPVTSFIWPPTYAISTAVRHSNKTLIADESAYQAGPSESIICTRMCVGDPIDTYSGNFYESVTDMSIAGRIGLEVKRRYSVGLLGNDGPFGDGWTMNYDMRLDIDEMSSLATVVEPSGNLSKFVGNDGAFVPQSDNLRADLLKTSSGWKYSRWDEDLTYIFDEGGVLNVITDENSNTVTIQHNADGTVAKVSEDEASLSFTWVDSRLAKVTDHADRAMVYAYTNGQLSSATDVNGNVTTYAYDAENRVTNMINAAGETTVNSYDDANRIATQELPSGQTLEFTYGQPSGSRVTNEITSGNVVKEYTYDDHGRITQFKDSSDATAKFTRTYDSSSNVLSEILIDGSPKDYRYSYTDGNLTQVDEQNAGSTQSFEYDDERRITATIDAAGLRTEQVYDDAGNLVSTTSIPAGDDQPRVTSYTVDDSGNTTSVTNPLGGVSTLEYNEADQLIAMTDPVGGKTTYDYDSLGRLVEEVRPGGNTTGISAADAAKFTSMYTYDAAGNVTEVNTATGITSYAYDDLNRPVSITDPDQKTKIVSYDGAGNPKKITYPDGSTDQFTYNVDTGARSSWTDPQGLTTSYEQTRTTFTTTSPDGTVTSLTKDIGSDYIDTKLIDDEHPSGIKISSLRANRSVSYPDAGKSNTANYNVAGQLTSEKSDGIEVDYSYDGFGQLLSQSGTDRNVSYTYDAAGNITGITYPDGTSISREMDLAGRITKITDWSGITYELAYNAAGQVAELSSSTGHKYAAQYDGLQLVSKNWTDELNAVIATFGYDYESSGLLASDSKALGSQPAAERDFQFNDNDALTAVNEEEVTWDSRLLTSTGDTALAYDSITSRLTVATRGSDTTSFTYDDRGNRLSSTTGEDTNNYEWNLLDQLTKLDNTSYTYGANGIRTKVGNNTQVYDQGLKLLTDGEMKYLWSADGALLAQAPLESVAAADTQYAVTDGMNSVYAVLDEQLAVLGEYNYTAFGERTLTTGADVSSMGFTSEQHDSSGLIYLRYRYMDPTVGQFISVDPLIGSTLDPYGYASGNPLQMTDPLGLMSWTRISKYLYTNSDVISTGLGLAGTAISAKGNPRVGLALSALGYAFNFVSTAKAKRDGDEIGYKLGVAAMFTPLSGFPAKAGHLLGLSGDGFESGSRAISTAIKSPSFYSDMRTIANKHWKDLTCI